MSILANLLHANREAILRVFVEKSRGTPAATLVQLAGGGERLLDLVASHRAEGDPSAAAWAEAFWRETDPDAVSDSDVLTGLAGLERIIRFHVVRQVADKKDLLAALGELGEAMDLLRRRSAEARLARDTSAAGSPEEHHRAFVALAEHSRDVICLATLQGKPFYLNKAGRRLVGIKDGEEIPLASLHGYHDDESWIELRDVGVPSVKRTGRWKTRAKLHGRASLEGVDVETTMFLVNGPEDDKPTCLGLVHRLLDRERKLEQALEESDARKRAILESSLDPIITIDHRGVISEFNRAAEQVFGRVRSEVLGTKPSDILFPPAKIARHQNRIDRYLDAGEGSLLSKRTEVVAIRASGLPFEAELTMTMAQQRGMPVLTFFVRDISLRKRAEEEQRRHAQELERSNRDLEQFAYVASHDLQEPLRKIRTFGDRLATTCGDTLPEPGRQCVERMQNAAERMQELIDGLLNLSRVTTKAVDFEQVDLMKVAREVVSDLEVKIDESGGRVEFERLPAIEADPLQIRQLLQNLVGNALKFHREGEPPRVQISARFVKGRDSLALDRSPEDERCRIEVKDNGIGFEEKYLDRIFEVFQRLHPRDVYEGTGVGLAICRKIVERHGGTITAQSEPGRGATFIVDLPVAQRKEG
jgi:two-component system sensor kinase FixL